MEDDEKPFFEAMLGTLKRVDQWRSRLDPDTPFNRIADGSPMSGDNKRLDPYQLSHAAWLALSHAVDHLHAHRSVLVDAQVIHMYAHYSLLRGAFENACTAVWMLAPAPRPERITRRLRFAVADIKNGDRVRELVGAEPKRTVEERVERIKGIAAACGIDPRKVNERIQPSEIVEHAGRGTRMGERVARLVWSLCSGTAHGDFWSMVTLADRVELPGAPVGMSHNRVTANVERMHFMTFFAAEMIDAGWRLYDERSRSPYESC